MATREHHLAERRTWFRHFPEGTLEFLLVTRVLVLLLLAVYQVVLSSQTTMLGFALVGMLCIDYGLMHWWAMQLVTDLHYLKSRDESSETEFGKHRVGSLIMVFLLISIVFRILSPWPGFDRGIPGLVYVGLGLWIGIFSYGPLRKIDFGPKLWVACWLVPVLHWFALHRLIRTWQDRIDQCHSGRTDQVEPPARAGIIAVDVLWFLSVAPWAALGLLTWSRTGGAGGLGRPLSLLGLAMGIIWLIAEVAMMENVQRRFLAVLNPQSSDKKNSNTKKS